jgi:hypothetical protein
VRDVSVVEPSPTGAVLDVGDELRVAGWHVPVTHMMGENEDRHTAAMVALPTPGGFEAPTAGDHRAGRQSLGDRRYGRRT